MTQMPPPARPDVMDFLLTRRSTPAKALHAPVPDAAVLTRLLTAAARSPDHGKLEPWRFIVLRGAALTRLSEAARARGLATGLDAEKAAGQFAASPLCVAVVSVPRSTEKIPQWEQHLSAGAVCLALVNAAMAQGFGACWLTGWIAYDTDFGETALGLGAGERIAGFIHIGTPASPTPDRPRPDTGALTTWVDA